jgi:hypothetical protein
VAASETWRMWHLRLTLSVFVLPRASSLLARLGLGLATSGVSDFLQNTVEPARYKLEVPTCGGCLRWPSHGDEGSPPTITKKGEIECASRPLVGFGVLNDNLIKGLISLIKCISIF